MGLSTLTHCTTLPDPSLDLRAWVAVILYGSSQICYPADPWYFLPVGEVGWLRRIARQPARFGAF